MNKDRQPSVSIIVPTYNRAQLIGRAIQSVLNQTYQDFEIIVVDDGSTDNTEEIVKGFQDERIVYIRHSKKSGGAAARNTGIKMSRGEYIAFQDSDDEWLPEKLKKQMEVFKNTSPKVGVIYTGAWRIENDNKTYIPYRWVAQKEGDIHKELLKGNFIALPTAVVKKECFSKVGIFDELLPRLQDWELMIRISKYYSFKFIDEPLVISYYTPDSISANDKNLIKALETILTSHFYDFKNYKRLLAKQYLYLGRRLWSAGDCRKARSYLIKAVKVYPFDIECLLTPLLLFSGEGMYNRVVKVYKRIRKNADYLIKKCPKD